MTCRCGERMTNILKTQDSNLWFCQTCHRMAARADKDLDHEVTWWIPEVPEYPDKLQIYHDALTAWLQTRPRASKGGGHAS